MKKTLVAFLIVILVALGLVGLVIMLNKDDD